MHIITRAKTPKIIMAASPPAPDPSARPLNHLGFVHASVVYLVDGGVKVLDAGLNTVVSNTGDTCRPCAEQVQRQTSQLAKRAAHRTKTGTTRVLQKLDSQVCLVCYTSISKYHSLFGTPALAASGAQVDRAVGAASTTTVRVRASSWSRWC